MDREKLEKFNKKLLEEKSMAEERIKRLKEVPEFGDDVDSLEEETNESQEYGNQLAEAQSYKEKLIRVENALNKIKNGKYGICEICGKEIEEAVLEAAPESRRCKECKKTK